MQYRNRLTVVALAATMLLAVGVSGASAGRLSTNEKGLDLIWNEALGAPKTKLRFIASGRTVACRVTLLGTFNERTIKKETAIDQGVINDGDLESCEGGTATIKEETMPWGLRYRGFTGTLPRIRSFTLGLIRVSFRFRESGGLQCEVATEVNHPAVVIVGNSAESAETGLEATGEPEKITAERANRIPLSGEFLCAFAGEGEVGGIGLIRNLPGTAKIRITLI